MYTADELTRVERELSRIGLLLQHDRALPSVTTLVAGSPITGSWWGHARGRDIYALLLELERGSGKVCCKLVDGKVTYVHPRLWPTLLTLALHEPELRSAELPALARKLLARVTRDGQIRGDVLRREGFAPERELAAAIRALELNLLLHSQSVHTASGVHVKLLVSWARWAADHRAVPNGAGVGPARRELAEAVKLLSRDAGRQPVVSLLEA